MEEETFAERLDRLATAANLADTELASILRVSEVQAKRYKEGTTPSIKFRAFLRLARRLRVSPWYLAGETEPVSERAVSVDTRDGPGDHAQSVTIVKPGDRAPLDRLEEAIKRAALVPGLATEVESLRADLRFLVDAFASQLGDEGSRQSFLSAYEERRESEHEDPS
jgi:transcriptional regulator with XRE-family HTH domain